MENLVWEVVGKYTKSSCNAIFGKVLLLALVYRACLSRDSFRMAVSP